EMGKLLGVEFLDLDRSVQEELCAGIHEAVEEYLTDAVRKRLKFWLRVRLSLAHRRAVAELGAAIKLDAAGIDPPIAMAEGRAYPGYPGLVDGRPPLPDELLTISGNFTTRIAEGVETTAVGWGRGAGGRSALTVAARAALVGPSALDPAAVRVVVVPLSGDQ